MGSKARDESHESCVCIVGFSACECQKKSVVYEMKRRDVALQRSRKKPIYSAETHSSDLTRSEMRSQCSFPGEVLSGGDESCRTSLENDSCSKVLNFLKRLDNRIRCTHKETVAAVKP